MSAGTLAALGLMSGTSLDGIDLAWIETDGEARLATGPSRTLPYDDAFRTRLRGLLGGQAEPAETRAAARELTLRHAEAAAGFLADCGLKRPDVVGFHGQTILHRPHEGLTWQIGDGALLAERLGVPVVSDFRSADVAAGGHGAPLAPAYHRALAAGLDKPLAVLNLGGVANLTWLGAADEAPIAFDTGPGNALIDDWALRHTGRPIDAGGALAAAGQADGEIVRRFLAHPYFAAPPPKSLDRDDFAHLLPHHLSPAAGAATLAAITVAAVVRALDWLPAPPRRWLVTGGGRHNPVLMALLAEGLQSSVAPVEAIGWDGDALEAQAFAYLAVRSLRGLPLSFPQTTGVPSPQAGGRLDRPAAAHPQS